MRSDQVIDSGVANQRLEDTVHPAKALFTLPIQRAA